MGTHHTEQRQSLPCVRAPCLGGYLCQWCWPGPGYLFLGIITQERARNKAHVLSWLQNHPSLDFHFIQLPLEKEKPKEGMCGVTWESSLSAPIPHVGVCDTKTKLCCGNLVSLEAVLLWAVVELLYIGSGSCMSLWSWF